MKMPILASLQYPGTPEELTFSPQPISATDPDGLVTEMIYGLDDTVECNRDFICCLAG